MVKPGVADHKRRRLSLRILADAMSLGFLPHPEGIFDNSPTPKAFGVGTLGKKRLSPDAATARQHGERDDRDGAVRRSSLRDYFHIRTATPNVETLGYFRMSLRDRDVAMVHNSGLRFSNPGDSGFGRH